MPSGRWNADMIRVCCISKSHQHKGGSKRPNKINVSISQVTGMDMRLRLRGWSWVVRLSAVKLSVLNSQCQSESRSRTIKLSLSLETWRTRRTASLSVVPTSFVLGVPLLGPDHIGHFRKSHLKLPKGIFIKKMILLFMKHLSKTKRLLQFIKQGYEIPCVVMVGHLNKSSSYTDPHFTEYSFVNRIVFGAMLISKNKSCTNSYSRFTALS